MNRPAAFDEFFNDYFGQVLFVPPFAMDEESHDMKIDVREGEKDFTVLAEIPGARRQDIAVQVEGTTVSLRARVRQETAVTRRTVYSERTYGAISRTFTLPAEVEPRAARAAYRRGVLELTLRKRSGRAARRSGLS
jgi:HSP20 family protein